MSCDLLSLSEITGSGASKTRPQTKHVITASSAASKQFVLHPGHSLYRSRSVSLSNIWCPFNETWTLGFYGSGSGLLTWGFCTIYVRLESALDRNLKKSDFVFCAVCCSFCFAVEGSIREANSVFGLGWDCCLVYGFCNIFGGSSCLLLRSIK